jgi:hypothetical protein
MSYNTAKIINVFYKEDRKPYDVNGKAISYFGEDFIGSNDATKIRFYFLPNQTLSGLTAIVHAKRADGDLRFEILSSSSDDLGNYFELTLNSWFALKVGKVTLSLKVYSGEPTYGMTGDVITSIESVAGLTIVASDIFSFNVGYAPNATEVVPPFEDGEFEQLLVALGDKPDFGETIYVVSALPTLTGDVFDNQWFLVKGATGEIGKLFHINGSTAEEVQLGVEQLNITPSGNGDVVSGSVRGQVKWNADLGTLSFGLYDDVEIGAGDTLFWFVKADEDIAKGDVVQFAGNVGGEILVKKAVFAEITAQPDLLMGVAKHAILDGNKGYIISAGRLNNINTSGFSTPILYLSTTTAGLLTSTKPTSGFKGSISAVGRFSTGGGNNGFLLVRPNLIKGVGELTDVTLTSTANGDVLRWNGSQWVNGNGLTVAEGEIDTLQSEMDAVEGRLDVVEPIVEQHTTDIGDLDDRIEFIEENGGIDFIKVDDFASLPTSGDVRNHRLFLTEDTKKLYEFDGITFNEVRQDKLQDALFGEIEGQVIVDGGTIISRNTSDDGATLKVINYKDDSTGDVLQVANHEGNQLVVARDGTVNAYGDLTIAGNLTVSGTTTTVNTATLDIEDNIITINKNQTGTPETTLLSGIEVERGDQTNFQFVFQESSDLFKVGQVGDLQAVATREDTPTDKGVAFFNTSTNKFETSSNLKVNTSGQLEDVTIRNSAVGVVPLVINGLASTTANLQEWKLNGTTRAYVDVDGLFRSGGLVNNSSFNNSLVFTGLNGTIVQRNRNTAEPTLIVNNANASSTGNIANFQFAGANKLEITKDGGLSQNGARLFTQTGVNTNTFFGINSGGTSTTGGNNTGFGRGSLNILSTGTDNTSFGVFSLLVNTTGGSNVAVGANALATNSTSSFNTAIGRNALSASTGSTNTSIGSFSGSSITGGSQNTFVGTDAGNNASQLATPSNSTAIGYQAYTDASNQMVFGNSLVDNYLFGRNTTAVKVGIGTTTPALLNFGNEFTISSANATNDQRVSVLNLQGNVVVDGGVGGVSYWNGATRIGSIVGSRSGADNSGRLTFSTSTLGTLTEKMTIMPNGNVGIGTSSPATKLEVAGASRFNGFAIGGQINIGTPNDALGFNIIKEDTSRADLRYEAGRLSFALRGVGTGVPTERMVITEGGNVGIGTTTPANLLELKKDLPAFRQSSVSESGGYVATFGLGYSTANSFVIDVNPSGTAITRIFNYGTNGNLTLNYNSVNPNRAFIVTNGNDERMRVTNGGLVGINETSPTAQLQVKSGATNRVGLIVDTLASQATDIVEFRNNGTGLVYINNTGRIGTNIGIGATTQNNAYVNTATTGTVISRNVADGNPALIAVTQHASSGDIARFQSNIGGTTATRLLVDKNGKLKAGSGDGEIHVTTQGVRIETLGNNLFVPLTVNKDDMTDGTSLQQWQYGTDNVAYIDENGDFYNATGSYGTISDLRVKENIVDARNYTEDLMKLRVVKYSLKDEESKTPTKLGFIAQEVEEVFPTMVQTTKTDDIEDLKSIKMSVLIPMLVKTIQELNSKIEVLEEKLK